MAHDIMMKPLPYALMTLDVSPQEECRNSPRSL